MSSKSVNLTVLPSASKKPAAKGAAAEEPQKPEYSSREVKPAALLLTDLLRAHSIFLLHHASSLSALFLRTKRSKFLGVLGRYWDSFLSTWNVLMHGNPANDLFGGIKIAACGELGVGVGEEDRGSGEREVLEGFVGRVDGLVDVIVSKFGVGEAPPDPDKSSPEKDIQHRAKPTDPWLGSGDDPAAEDGAIFLGTGALSRKSLRDISHWAEDLYRWGPQAYGVMDNPTATRRTKAPKGKDRPKGSELSPSKRRAYDSGVVSRKESREPDPGPMNTLPPTPFDEHDPANNQASTDQAQPNDAEADVDSMGNKFVQYLKLGYGTHWSVSGTPTREDGQSAGSQDKLPSAGAEESPAKTVNSVHSTSATSPNSGVAAIPDDSKGHYLVGLLGDIDEEIDGDPVASDDDTNNSRLQLRTLSVELEHEDELLPETDVSIDLGSTSSDNLGSTEREAQDQNKTKKLRVVVYVKRPFIFVLLFDIGTQGLALPGLYRSLHYQIGPLIKPLLVSTSFRAWKPDIGGNGRGDSVTPIYDLIWDPKLLTVNSTIPNIPDPYMAPSKFPRQFIWPRIEALNTHMQIINTRVTTADGVEKERTCKTSRGWWVVWTRVSDTISQAAPRSSQGTSRRTSTSDGGDLLLGTPEPKDKEIFLIRRASDNVGGKLSSRLVSGASTGGDGGWASGPGRLAQGIGIDTKRYIESLLNLSG